MNVHGIALRTVAIVFAAASMLACAQTSVPYVGCSGDGQTGPYQASEGSPKPVKLPPEIANKLAWYEYKGDAGQVGTLGPRGWNCFVTIGSNGETLYIAPETMNSAKILEHKEWQGFTGPAIQVSGSDGGTSGRFRSGTNGSSCFPRHIAATPARSSQRALVPPQTILSVLIPSDHLTYKSKKLVEFTTPSHRKGLGTTSWLLPSDQPILGFALLTIGPDVDAELLQLSLRLPPSLSALSPTLVRQAEEDAASDRH